MINLVLKILWLNSENGLEADEFNIPKKKQDDFQVMFVVVFLVC